MIGTSSACKQRRMIPIRTAHRELSRTTSDEMEDCHVGNTLEQVTALSAQRRYLRQSSLTGISMIARAQLHMPLPNVDAS